MKQIGIIVRQTRKKATVRVKRPTSCGENCAHCAGCPTTDQLVTAANPIGAPRGATVEIETPDRKVFFAAFLVYVLPLLFFIGGYVAATRFTNVLPLQILFSFGCLAIFFFALRRIDAKLLKKGKYEVTVTRVLYDGNENTTGEVEQ